MPQAVVEYDDVITSTPIVYEERGSPRGRTLGTTSSATRRRSSQGVEQHCQSRHRKTGPGGLVKYSTPIFPSTGFTDSDEALRGPTASSSISRGRVGHV